MVLSPSAGSNAFDGYTKSQIDALLNNLKSTYLTSNYFVRNGNSSKPFTLTYGDEDSNVSMPDGKIIYANVLDTKVPLSSRGVMLSPDLTTGKGIGQFQNETWGYSIKPGIQYVAPKDQFLFYGLDGDAGNGYFYNRLYVNNVMVGHVQGSDDAGATNWYFLRKGDVVTSSGSYFCKVYDAK